MKPRTENQLAGKVQEVKGPIKQKAGRLMHNFDLEDEGAEEKITGNVQKKIGQVQEAIEKF